MRFDFTLGGPSGDAARRAPGTVRRLVVLGDLRGNGATSDDGLLDRRLAKVDIDTLDDVLARCGPSIQLGAAAGGERIGIARFEDFHPDCLVEALSVFQRLRDLRGRLGHPATFASAAAELQAESGTPASASPAPLASEGGDASVLERLLGTAGSATPSAGPAAAPPAAASAIDALIRQAIAPHIVPAPNPQPPQLLSAVDAAMTDMMRAVLHDPAFQAVEAAWRGLQWLVSTLELGESLELLALHVTRAELALAAARDGELWRRLVERESTSGDGHRFTALVGNFVFGPSVEDVAVLGDLGALASALGAPFIAGASPALLGATSLAAQPDPRGWAPLASDDDVRWQALRSRSAASHVGLALPRFLLRLPYGKRTDAITAFEFEEQPARPEHESFLWGNAAFAYGVAVARALDPEGDPTAAGSIERLPAFVFATDEGPALQPSAEIALTDTAVTALQSRGLMPVIGFKDRDAVRLVWPASIASPSTDLLS